MTPVLLVNSIETALSFWVDLLGWQKTVEVPDGDKLSFVILVNENLELMLQTIESARRDQPALAGDSPAYRTSLFIEVTDWDDVLRRVSTYEVTMPERETFYGMREIGILDPDRNIIIFAQRVALSAD